MPPRRATATVQDVCAAMEAIAPTWAAADWDNVGLLTGATDWPARRLLLTIDLTPAVADEAVARKADLVIAYHPPIFRAVKRFRPDMREQDGIAAELLSRRIAVYSPHTALDAAPGGTNDALAGLAGLIDLRPFKSAPAPAREYKLVTFVPAGALERVAEAVHDAGAGVIGDYTRCSYRLEGAGTFFGGDATNPARGRRGRLERVAETRFETVVPAARLGSVVAALRAAHPYEEPAFDIYRLVPQAPGGIGQGRIGRFETPIKLGTLARDLARRTKAAAPAVVGNSAARISRGFVCVGSAGTLPLEADDADCGPGDVVITGEIRHHDALKYERCGASAVALGHSTSERPVLKPLRKRLANALAGIDIDISRKDCDPFVAIK